MQRIPLYREFSALCAIILLVGIAACSTLGVAPADTFNKQAAIAVATVTEVRETAAAALQAGKITPAQAQTAQNTADQARADIQAARAVAASGDFQNATTRIDQVNAVLRAVHSRLVQQQTVPKN